MRCLSADSPIMGEAAYLKKCRHEALDGVKCPVGQQQDPKVVALSSEPGLG
jgi:hypothetical protein